MRSIFYVTVLIVLKLSHVNSQDDEYNFDTTTIETTTEQTATEIPLEEEVKIITDITTTDTITTEITTTETTTDETTTDETPTDETTTDEATTTDTITTEITTTETSTDEATTAEKITTEQTATEIPQEEEVKMSEYILKVLEHYKQPNPEGWPGAKLPDPLVVPDSNQFLGFATNLDFKNTTLYGVNKFKIIYINADIEKMECRAAFEMDNLQVNGKYSLNVFFNSYPGGFASNISGIKSEVVASLGVEQDGQLRARDISVDISFKNITMQFENAGLLASMLQGIFNSMGSILYDSIKNYLLDDAEKNMRNDINNKLDQVVGNIEFPNTITIVDMVLVDVRKKIKDIKMDPLIIEDYASTIGIFKFALNNTVLKGLSTFHRIGNVKFRLENKLLLADFEIGTKELQGTTCWEFSGINGFINNTGSVSFSIAYVQGRFVLSQPLDIREKTEFRDLQLEVGNIQFGSDGLGTLDYILEVSGNILPTLLRYQIISAIEIPLKWKIQQELDEMNTEELIINTLPKIDEIQKSGFKLADLRMLNTTDEINFEDDEFFNF